MKCPLCRYSVPCENNPCGLRNDGEIRPGDWAFTVLGYSSQRSQSVPGRVTLTTHTKD